ncbi:hypothetical protein PHAVU_007G162400 [Phaseolus vulgaris]|uniref:Uncharacterized protein n=1 Tax=Phaseolus vulgaris TaxID=3885 RepID=V7BF72_PHAVU|nr:hypothetical protein PHAVU_007G162400g [Phaseolus vulgaris]ESW16509.1 hypothetical protein PHAVU_007G162400g [Phaseolus vulgaris]
MYFYFFEFKISKHTSWASISGVKGRTLLTLFQSFYKSFKGEIHKIQQPDHIPALLEGLPLYWSSRPNCQPTRTLEDLDTRELGDCKKLDELGIVFETPILLKLES